MNRSDVNLAKSALTFDFSSFVCVCVSVLTCWFLFWDAHCSHLSINQIHIVSCWNMNIYAGPLRDIRGLGYQFDTELIPCFTCSKTGIDLEKKITKINRWKKKKIRANKSKGRANCTRIESSLCVFHIRLSVSDGTNQEYRNFNIKWRLNRSLSTILTSVDITLNANGLLCLSLEITLTIFRNFELFIGWNALKDQVATSFSIVNNLSPSQFNVIMFFYQRYRFRYH